MKKAKPETQLRKQLEEIEKNQEAKKQWPELTEIIHARVTADQKRVFELLGGSAWLRAILQASVARVIQRSKD